MTYESYLDKRYVNLTLSLYEEGNISNKTSQSENSSTALENIRKKYIDNLLDKEDHIALTSAKTSSAKPETIEKVREIRREKQLEQNNSVSESSEKISFAKSETIEKVKKLREEKAKEQASQTETSVASTEREELKYESFLDRQYETSNSTAIKKSREEIISDLERSEQEKEKNLEVLREANEKAKQKNTVYTHEASGITFSIPEGWEELPLLNTDSELIQAKFIEENGDTYILFGYSDIYSSLPFEERYKYSREDFDLEMLMSLMTELGLDETNTIQKTYNGYKYLKTSYTDSTEISGATINITADYLVYMNNGYFAFYQYASASATSFIDYYNDFANILSSVEYPSEMENSIIMSKDEFDSRLEVYESQHQPKEVSPEQALGYIGIGVCCIALLSALIAIALKFKSKRRAKITEIKFCHKCGSKLKGDSQFCKKCGTEIPKIQQGNHNE